MTDVLEIFTPGRRFPAVSLTGCRCDLQCEHCKGAHLKGMVDASRDLVPIALNIRSGGGNGVLISGGSDLAGKVPVTGRADEIRRISETGMRINAHTGFLAADDAITLVDAGVDMFSVDVHQDPVIIKNVLRLDAEPDMYRDTIVNILSANGRVMPHITAGFGTYDMKESAKLVRDIGLRDVVLLALVPTKGTAIIENMSEESILEAIATLIQMRFNVTLGCMRPRIHRELEIKAIIEGVRRIANPSPNTLEWAKDNGFTIEKKDTCCCF